MIKIREKGLQDYVKTWEEMKYFTENRNCNTPDELWTLEHHSVFTQGLYWKTRTPTQSDLKFLLFNLIEAVKLPIMHQVN